MLMTHSPAAILVVDDDPLTLTGIAATLGMAGHQCHCAGSVSAAVQTAKALHLDLVVTDVVVYGESGLELCREIRREPHNADVPALFVASGQTPDIIRRSHDAGGAYYLRKPFDPEVLVELVSKALWMPHLVKSNIERREPASRPKPSGLQHFTNTNRRRTFQMFRQDA
jgi:DNA-binding response OmpR family regulator